MIEIYDVLILYKYSLYDREEFTDLLERFCKFLEKESWLENDFGWWFVFYFLRGSVKYSF
jgi:hypothetical protein